jgi:hypothetical protein
VKGERMTIPPECSPLLANMMALCWQENPEARPSFLEIASLLKEDPTSNSTPIQKEDTEEHIYTNSEVEPKSFYG